VVQVGRDRHRHELAREVDLLSTGGNADLELPLLDVT
jgi:hypothetical protein